MLRTGNQGHQLSLYSTLYDKIPEDHILRRINHAVDFSFINDLLSGQRDGSSVLLSVPAQYHALLAMDSSSNQQLTCLNAIPRNP